MAERGIKRRRHPYRIPPVSCPDAATLKRLDPWHVQEFFRVELLLRSQPVMDLYRSEEISPTSSMKLLLQYGFGWEVLGGAPYHCLKPKKGPLGAIPGLTVWNTDTLAQLIEVLQKLSSGMSVSERQEMMARFQERFLCLLADPALPPDTVLKALRPELEARHRRSKATARGKPRKFDVRTWSDYLACYDLHVTGLGYGQW